MVWPPECVTSGRTKPICPPRVGPFFACACGALLPCGCGCGALLSCACSCGALLSCACNCGALLLACACGCGALLSCACGCGALISCACSCGAPLCCAWASGALPARVVASIANTIDALLILFDPPIRSCLRFLNLLLLVCLMPPVKRIENERCFPSAASVAARAPH